MGKQHDRHERIATTAAEEERPRWTAEEQWPRIIEMLSPGLAVKIFYKKGNSNNLEEGSIKLDKGGTAAHKGIQ